MSMLSSMCDNLRLMARLVRDYDYDVISHELRHAADTIWELRNKCNDLIDEREELSRRLEHATEMNSMLICMPEHERRAIASTLTTIDGINLSERIRELEAENAKLRELCGDLFDRLIDKDEHCGECRSQCEHDAWNFGDPKCVYAKRMRELGVPH